MDPHGSRVRGAQEHRRRCRCVPPCCGDQPQGLPRLVWTGPDVRDPADVLLRALLLPQGHGPPPLRRSHVVRDGRLLQAARPHAGGDPVLHTSGEERRFGGGGAAGARQALQRGGQQAAGGALLQRDAQAAGGHVRARDAGRAALSRQLPQVERAARRGAALLLALARPRRPREGGGQGAAPRHLLHAPAVLPARHLRLRLPPPHLRSRIGALARPGVTCASLSARGTCSCAPLARQPPVTCAQGGLGKDRMRSPLLVCLPVLRHCAAAASCSLTGTPTAPEVR
mmetsp:Transcript_3501/g.7353  ORF Transcript_3501/g.7353 Transcript_3501/m.7353 type:complete len:284 (+) Transcript_3501:453-1304(+)